METPQGWLILALAWAACVGYMAFYLRQGWTPCDAGVLAQSAERVLHGQLPHRDFQEIYTGGLSYFNALAFRLFGTNLFSLRIPFFLFFVGWVPAVYLIARRFARPIVAGAITLFGAAWGPVVYPEAMASWYNLFFATWGALALLRYTVTRRQKWLWVAGMCGGLSFLVKLSGLYFVFAALLFFIFKEQVDADAERKDSPQPVQRAWVYRLFRGIGLLVFLLGLTIAISGIPTAGNYINFALPSACLVAYLAWAGRVRSSIGNIARLRQLFSMVLPFLAAAFLPVAVFLAWYAHKGALMDWYRGTFLGPMPREYWASAPFGLPVLSVGLIPLVVALLLAYDSKPSSRSFARIAIPGGLALLLVAAWKIYPIYLVLGDSLPSLVPLMGFAAPFCLWAMPNTGKRREATFLVVSAALLCALIQFPSSVAIYFNYAAPLVILALLALLSGWKRGDAVVLGSVVAFYLAFAVWLRPPGYYFEVHRREFQPFSYATLRLSRAGGIRVRSDQAQEYEKLIGVVRAHARGSYIYATPDCPQVYFLSGMRNPTRTMFEFLDPNFPNPILHTQNVLQAIDDHGINLVVIGPQLFEPPLPRILTKALDKRFPDSEKVGHFEVRWKR